jgi:hypothetical protein
MPYDAIVQTYQFRSALKVYLRADPVHFFDW